MGASGSSDAASNSDAFASGSSSLDPNGVNASKIKVTLEDLELPPRRDDKQAAAAALAQLQGGGGAGMMPMPGSGSASASSAIAGPSVTEEIFPGGEALGQQAFREDGLVGTESQQLQLLAHYAELCDDFRRYQWATRAEGAPRASDGAQLLLLSGPPGTGKTRHAVSFSKALGLPLLLAQPPRGGNTAVGPGVQSAATGWAAQLRREVHGRDCCVFLDEIDQHVSDEGFASALRQFLDGVCQPSGSRVLLVGTTNRLDRLPKDVLHRAEVINFDRPEANDLSEMWRSYAQHLREPELRALGNASLNAGATGRDVRHCAGLCERQMAIKYLNTQHGQGYCHGAALSNCPGPPLEKYIRCVMDRATE